MSDPETFRLDDAARNADGPQITVVCTAKADCDVYDPESGVINGKEYTWSTHADFQIWGQAGEVRSRSRTGGPYGWHGYAPDIGEARNTAASVVQQFAEDPGYLVYQYGDGETIRDDRDAPNDETAVAKFVEGFGPPGRERRTSVSIQTIFYPPDAGRTCHMSGPEPTSSCVRYADGNGRGTLPAGPKAGWPFPPPMCRASDAHKPKTKHAGPAEDQHSDNTDETTLSRSWRHDRYRGHTGPVVR